MSDRDRRRTTIDVLAIPGLLRDWMAMSRRRKLLWGIKRGLTFAVLYAVISAVILVYNEPAFVEGVIDGERSILGLGEVLADDPQLALLLVLIAGILLVLVIAPIQRIDPRTGRRIS